MLKLCCLVLLISASVFSESVRETETWVPMKSTTKTASAAAVSMATHTHTNGDGLEASGDFGFTDNEDEEEEEESYDEDYNYDDEDDEDEDDEEFSGSGDGATTLSPARGSTPSTKPDLNDNRLPEAPGGGGRVRPTVDEVELVQTGNHIPDNRRGRGRGNHGNQGEREGEEGEEEGEEPSNVLMSHTNDQGIFSKTEVLAALIAGGGVGLLFAVLLVLLLVHRMKKKDEGSYELGGGRRPIYKKAPTTEIYA